MRPRSLTDRRRASAWRAAQRRREVDARGRLDLLARGDELARELGRGEAGAGRCRRRGADAPPMPPRTVSLSTLSVLTVPITMRVRSATFCMRKTLRADGPTSRQVAAISVIADAVARPCSTICEAAPLASASAAALRARAGSSTSAASWRRTCSTRAFCTSSSPSARACCDATCPCASATSARARVCASATRLALSRARRRDRGVDLRHLRLAAVAGRLHRALGLGARLGDERLLLHLGRLLAPDAVEVVHVVGDVLDLQRVELEPEAPQIVLGLDEQRLRELDLVLVELLGRERREHAAQVALEHVLRHRHDPMRDRRRGSARWRCRARAARPRS